MGRSAPLLARPISSATLVRSLRSSTRRRSIWSMRSRHLTSVCRASRDIGFLKISCQVAHERFELRGVTFDLAHNGAADDYGFDMIGQRGHVFRLRDAKTH